MDTGKFNTIMPETDDKTLCVLIEKPISAEGYDHNFLPRFKDIINRNGEARLLVYYKDFKGWEKGAVASDMEMTSLYGKKIKRFALVNPPSSEVFQKKIKAPLFDTGALRLFTESELDKALDWVKE